MRSGSVARPARVMRRETPSSVISKSSCMRSSMGAPARSVTVTNTWRACILPDALDCPATGAASSAATTVLAKTSFMVDPGCILYEVTNERRLPDGRVELIDTRRVEASPIYNHDLAPVPIARRNWSTYNFAALWISMAHCIPTYMLASGLMASGMNWSQAIVTILLGNTIVLIPILLNSHPGTKYGIPFPVFARAAYGTFGS